MFDYLTLSVVIDDRIFCVHGGLSPSIHSIDQIKVVDRFREIPHEGPMADLVWSDPDAEKEDFAISPRFFFSYNMCHPAVTKVCVGERATPLAHRSYESSCPSTRWLIFCVHISCAWRDIAYYLIIISVRSGVRLIIAIGECMPI